MKKLMFSLVLAALAGNAWGVDAFYNVFHKIELDSNEWSIFRERFKKLKDDSLVPESLFQDKSGEYLTANNSELLSKSDKWVTRTITVGDAKASVFVDKDEVEIFEKTTFGLSPNGDTVYLICKDEDGSVVANGSDGNEYDLSMNRDPVDRVYTGFLDYDNDAQVLIPCEKVSLTSVDGSHLNITVYDPEVRMNVFSSVAVDQGPVKKIILQAKNYDPLRDDIENLLECKATDNDYLNYLLNLPSNPLRDHASIIFRKEGINLDSDIKKIENKALPVRIGRDGKYSVCQALLPKGGQGVYIKDQDGAWRYGAPVQDLDQVLLGNHSEPYYDFVTELSAAKPFKTYDWHRVLHRGLYTGAAIGVAYTAYGLLFELRKLKSEINRLKQSKASDDLVKAATLKRDQYVRRLMKVGGGTALMAIAALVMRHKNWDKPFIHDDGVTKY